MSPSNKIPFHSTANDSASAKFTLVLRIFFSAHLVGGFSQSFSSGNVCRFCHINYLDLQNADILAGHVTKWTSEEYDRAVDVIEKEISKDFQ